MDYARHTCMSLKVLVTSANSHLDLHKNGPSQGIGLMSHVVGDSTWRCVVLSKSFEMNLHSTQRSVTND